MSKVEAMLPQLRFQKFDSAWQLKKLNTIVTQLKSYPFPRTYEVNENTGVKYVHYGDIHRGIARVINHDDKLPNIKKDKYITLQKGDLVLADASEDYKGIGSPSVINIEPKNEVIAGLHTIALRPKKQDPLFLYYLFNTDSYKRHGNRVGTGMKVFGITFTNLSKFKTFYPDIKEQTKIGELFQKLDRAIELQQQKVEQSERYKKAMLQKMFPQKGETEPQLRFEGFSGEWKTQALSDIAQIVGGGTPDTTIPEYWNGDINWYSPTEIGLTRFVKESTRKITDLGFQKSSARLLPANQTVLFTSRAGIGDMAILKAEGTTNQGFQSLIVNDHNDVYFIYSMGHLIKREALRVASGSTFLEISGKALGKIKLKFPLKKEQTKIGEFFQALDARIEVETKKLNHYESLKKAMLQRMFV